MRTYKSSATRFFTSFRKNESGYALPSVLFLVVLLTTVAFTVISFLFLQRKLVLSDVHQVQAEYAAESGIVKALAEFDARSKGITDHRYEFEDGSRATVSVRPWGSVLYGHSRGVSHEQSAENVALLANLPSNEFDYSLKFCNPQHALVLAGTTAVKGTVVVGNSGASTGSLKDYPTPRTLPIDGKVIRQQSPELPAFRTGILEDQIDFFNRALTKNELRDGSRAVFVSDGKLDLNSIENSTDYVLLTRSSQIFGIISRRARPLYVVCSGTLSFESSAAMSGLVAFLANESITISPTIKSVASIFYSRSSVVVSPGATFSAQLISPEIEVLSNATLGYPSFIVSIPSQSGKQQRIQIQNGTTIEGTVILLSGDNSPSEEKLIVLEKSAMVVGAVISQAGITLDGSVYGTVVTKDFYFYEAPTKYLGWLRSAHLDLSQRPSGFLVPVGFSEKLRLDILQWL